MRNTQVFLRRNWPILLLLIFVFIVRIVKLEELFYFTYDESVFAFVGRRMWLWYHLPLIGGATPFGFHVAPYFYWFFSLILIIGKLNPIVWGYAAAVLSIITAILIYTIGKNVSDKKTAITALIIYTFSFFTNIYDRHFWGLYFGSVFTLIVVYCLSHIIKKPKRSDLLIYVLFISLALIIHADLSFYVLLILTAVIWSVFKIPITRSAKIGLMLIFASFIPLIIFDFRHNFSNTKPFLTYLAQEKTSRFHNQTFIDKSIIFPNSFVRVFYTFGDSEVSKNYSYCPSFIYEKYKAIPPLLTIISMFVLGYSIYWALKINKKNEWKIMAILFLIYYAGILIYGLMFKADIFEHYLVGLFPVLVFISAKIIAWLPKPLWLFAIAIFISINLIKLSDARSGQGLKYKKDAIKYTMQEVGQADFSLDSLSTCWKWSGYRYLFAVFGREPIKSYVDPNFAYLYGKTAVSPNHPATVATFVFHDYIPETSEFYKRYTILKSHQVSSATFANIEVIIMDNSTSWF